jgi:pyrimidine deaminase RibD-like protein
MTCAKKKVICVILTPRGEIFIGENSCLKAQLNCPRLLGEGYEKCRRICAQSGHAEIVAIANAGTKARGATAIITHKRICQECSTALDKAGIKTRILIA